MSPFGIAALSLSMSADAFAASIARGAATRPTLSGALKGGLVFGVIEALTPLLGWMVGIATASFVGAVDHWIAFTLLGFVGGRMIWEALTREDADEDEAVPAASGWRGALALVAVAIGTSIDAAAVGVSLALVGQNIVMIAAAIGFATFAMTTIGLSIGRMVGSKLGRVVEMAGGATLIAIGSWILADHLGAFA
ncbi:manganese efflux pump MntP family protein [Sphingomonas sp. HF-S4]|uniref:Putative manganese efflux pump MntP n=1 Tax=Sphingomonas agrestis TaxID=3080540 RepID=A0ABU3Y9K2_9SPHN|nr:manganese efflux pump MntP family protein [Sphingomonas sp. HF-S4]MDV3458066.1 manganese efflux pump MntP family protein [Sphingomonas sp. HF-S4]